MPSSQLRSSNCAASFSDGRIAAAFSLISWVDSVKFTTCFMFKNLDSKGDSNKKSIDLPF